MLEVVVVVGAWILLPSVMFGGYALMIYCARGGVLDPEHERWFRAGHAHAGTLISMMLLYVAALDDTGWSPMTRAVCLAVAAVRFVCVVGGMFLQMVRAREATAPRLIVSAGSLLLGLSVLALAGGIATS